MGFGEEWGYGANKGNSQSAFKAFLDAGGNFIDTANRYTEGTCETFLGEFTKGIRDELVIATKYTLYTKRGNPNDGGNHKKNLLHSVEGSLKRLNTDYIDVLYLHAWDYTTSVEEVLRSLDDLVSSGKALYIAISDTPAWIISKANTIADFRGWNPFVAVQLEYSLITRDAERELLPMAKALDLCITSWGPLAGGALTGKYLEETSTDRRLKPGSKRLNEKSVAITKEVVTIAKELGCTPTHVALAWQFNRGQQIIPIVGAKSAEQVKDIVGCIEVKLTPEQVQRLDEVSKIDLGFPNDFLSSDVARSVVFGGIADRVLNHRL
jgi:aryl-alcohol dehydrogenase-like predicted oxidoreductase